MSAHRAARRALSVAVALVAGWVAGAVGFAVWCWIKARKHWGHVLPTIRQLTQGGSR